MNRPRTVNLQVVINLPTEEGKEKPTGDDPREERRIMIEELGSFHFHCGVPLHKHPALKDLEEVALWKKSWENTLAFKQGYEARVNGAATDKNPYARSTGAKRNRRNKRLAEHWWYGHDVADLMLERYAT